jgi:hypothetical protein
MQFTKQAHALSLLIVGMGLAVNGHCQSIPTNGLAVYYPFSGNANDASGNGNNGTVDGTTLTVDRFGHANSAYYFNGVNGDILVPETVFSATDAAWSVSVWITLGSGPYSNAQQIYAKSSLNGQIGITILSGQVDFAIKTASGAFYMVGAPLITNSTMHVVAVYQKGQNMSLYIDGVLSTSTAVPNGDLYSTSDYLISALGSYHYTLGPSQWFRETIDDFRVYTRALSASEVQQLYLYEAFNCPSPIITSQSRGGVGYWGKSLTLNVAAVGDLPVSYAWLKDGIPLQGASGSSLVLTNLQVTNAGNYSVVVSNGCGTTTSSNAYVTINPAGVSLALYSGITIDGVVGLTYGVQYNTDLSNTNGWHGLANITLSVPTEVWFDLQPASRPQRFYRVVPGPISIP